VIGVPYGTNLTNTLGAPNYPLNIGPPPPPGDFDEDSDVDSDDLTRWKSGFSSVLPSHLLGDADGDQDVDGADFLIWQRQLGSDATVAVTAAVPEPATLLLLVSGVLAAFFGRRVVVS